MNREDWGVMDLFVAYTVSGEFLGIQPTYPKSYI